MKEVVRLGIIICNRYATCAGGKCLRALYNREGAFDRYKDKDVQLVGYTTCSGCPGGNVEYAPAEMKKERSRCSASRNGDGRRLSSLQSSWLLQKIY